MKHPFSNHNGGQLVFAPDGLLYIGMGDGGSAGDPHDNGQTRTYCSAKIWNLDVDAGPAPEVVEYGSRNPWRFSFDPTTGDLYIGDVGQDKWEETSTRSRRRDPSAGNFGWACARAATPSTATGGDRAARSSQPVAGYPHGPDGCSVTGGLRLSRQGDPVARRRVRLRRFLLGHVWSLKVVKGKATGLRREPVHASRA